jgi:hypothetical protein
MPGTGHGYPPGYFVPAANGKLILDPVDRRFV